MPRSRKRKFVVANDLGNFRPMFEGYPHRAHRTHGKVVDLTNYKQRRLQKIKDAEDNKEIYDITRKKKKAKKKT